MKTQKLLVVLALVVTGSAAIIAGCSNNPGSPGGNYSNNPPAPTPTTTNTNSATSFVSSVYPIVSSSCFSCHANGGSGTGYMNLGSSPSSSSVYSAWVGVSANSANNCSIANYISTAGGSTGLSQSLIIQKIIGSCSPQMPDGGSLTSQQIATFSSWVSAGAPNN